MSAPPPRSGRRSLAALPHRDRSLIFGLVVAWAAFAGLYPWFPGIQRFETGVTSRLELRSPSNVTYASEVRTAQARDAAAAAVPDVRVYDPAIRARRMGDLDRRLERIDTVRRDVTLSVAARDSAVRSLAEDALSERGGAALVAASDAQWRVVVEQARSALGRVLANPIASAEDIATAKAQTAEGAPPELGPELTQATVQLLDPFVLETVVVDRARTAARRADAMNAVPPVLVSVGANEVVISPGQLLGPLEIEKLDWLGLRSRALSPAALLATALMSALIGATWGGHLYVMRPTGLRRLRHLALAALLVAVAFASMRVALPLVLPDAASRFLVNALPVAAVAITAAVLLDATTALVVSLTMAIGLGFLAANLPPENGPLGSGEISRFVMFVAATSIAGVLVAAKTDRLPRLFGAGAAAGATGAGVALAFWLLDPGRQASSLAWLAAASATGGVLAALLAVGALVALSRPFGVVTRVRLMELAQLSHPLLRRLQDEAPGTFQHAVLVGNLAERAADRIGADAQLVRVGAYYHDVGKLVAPAFFVENAHPEANPHEGLDPLQSTRVIHQHVTAGIELARRAGLPPAVTQFIPEHHGTRLMTYFYRRAAEADPDVDAELFRYPGPRPSSRESALVMIADACEATVRASLDRTEERIRAIVDGIVRERIEEGQFDECDLSLRDLAVAADSFTRSLTAVYHPRVAYPEPTARELDARRVDPLPERPALPPGRPASTALDAVGTDEA
ncbi:MAG: HDIG domain-containing protein [Dehalococcoidia bacterium]